MACLFLPVGGGLIFNVLGEMVKSGAKAEIPLAIWDFSLGCALAIVGVAVAQSNLGRARNLFIWAICVLFILTGVDIILRHKFDKWELAWIAISDAIAFGAVWRAMSYGGTRNV